MNLIPHSNGIKRVKKRKALTPKALVKIIALTLLGILVSGFLFQKVKDFIGNERIESSLNYAKVDDKRMEYKVSGSGDYTVVFDGSIGANLYEWNEVCKKAQSELGVRTFVYNRRGYGFNENVGEENPTKQAEELKILLRKAGVSGNLIFVGEEYGSLIATAFAKLYPESVKGMVLVKPLDEEKIKDTEFKKSIRWKYYKSKVESVGASIGLTTLLDSMNLAISIDGFEENLPKGVVEEYKVHKNQSNYRTAIYDELKALYTYTDTNQTNGMFNNIPLYIISKEEEDSLRRLGNKDLTMVYETSIESPLVSINDSNAIVTGISYTLKEAKKIEKLSNR